jgi:cellulose synthase/poly-beta-1,6-N-acetylglucosamine synthase-like glycosyltransferase
MNKKLIIGAVAVYVVFSLLDWLVNAVLLAPTYETIKHLLRPQEEMKMWVIFVSYLFLAFFFTFIWSKGYEGKGIMEGVRYGFYVALMMVLPYSYMQYAVMPVPYSLTITSFLCGTVEFVICGVVLALIWGAKGKEGSAPAS